VVGVLAADATLEGAVGAGVEGAGREVYLPITSTLRDAMAGREGVREIWLRIHDGIGPEQAAPVVERALLRRHDGRRGFEVATPERLLRQQRAARGLLDLLLGLVAAAAFALGGVGMMSVAWQAVAERTGEIAVRRAVGARRGEILAQFLVEGALLAGAGALAGVVAGAAVSAAAAWAAGWPWLLSPGRLFLAAGVAIAVGLLSTFHPASRAASLDPVAALRFER
jgi:putative ABC transport system permease protein